MGGVAAVAAVAGWPGWPRWPRWRGGRGGGVAGVATTRTGHSYVVTALAENPAQPIDETLGLPIMGSAIRGAFALAARG